jgi:hypothetical protein
MSADINDIILAFLNGVAIFLCARNPTDLLRPFL